MNVLVTGANGYIGRALCAELEGRGFVVRRAVRRASRDNDAVEVGDVGPATDWRGALGGIDTVVHLVAHVHRRGRAAPHAHFSVNAEGTRRLAECAADAGVRRVVFVSTVAVHTESSSAAPLTERSPLLGRSAYALSKRAAEEALRRASAEGGFDVVVVRPPMVYGPGAPGNFERLCRAVRTGLPLPLGAIHNARSLIYVHNLTDFLCAAAARDAAANETFLVSDGEDVSTTDLVRAIRSAGKGRWRAPLLPVPVSLLERAGSLAGRAEEVRKLTGTLRIDCSHARARLGWSPPFQMMDALAVSARTPA